jgi:hypothetical protein
MTSKITIEKALFDDLLDTKISVINEKISLLLKKWHYESTSLFLQHAANGILDDAEPDAISLTNLLDKREEYYKIKLAME